MTEKLAKQVDGSGIAHHYEIMERVEVIHSGLTGEFEAPMGKKALARGG